MLCRLCSSNAGSRSTPRRPVFALEAQEDATHRKPRKPDPGTRSYAPPYPVESGKKNFPAPLDQADPIGQAVNVPAAHLDVVHQLAHVRPIARMAPVAKRSQQLG